MTNPGVNKEIAEQRLIDIEEFLAKGHCPAGVNPPPGQFGAVRMATEKYGLSSGSAGTFLEAAQRGAGRKVDWSLWKRPIEPVYNAPDGQKISGVSSLVDPATGEVRLQWIKTTADQERQQQMWLAACEAASKKWHRAKPIKAPKSTAAKLCNQYTITDYHMGMLSWPKETGAAWDISIAQKMLVDAMADMIARSPDAETAIICQLGDFMHVDGSDGMKPVTPSSKHIQDVDGRFSKLVAATIASLRAIIDMALSKHKKVHLIAAEGNHDMASSVWMRKMMAAMYENEPRLTVDDSELPYYAYQHGKVMLAYHHGHIKKPDALPGMFAAQFPEMWGQTMYRYAHSGHKHFKYENEKNGMEIIQHPTLAAKDAYSARGGWHSQRRALSITYHADFGEWGRVYVTPEMLV
tara:strand:+ start:914 stop:2137 length:1224 start_codon:yes stop_codon:yes gene_type:complete